MKNCSGGFSCMLESAAFSSTNANKRAILGTSAMGGPTCPRKAQRNLKRFKIALKFGKIKRFFVTFCGRLVSRIENIQFAMRCAAWTRRSDRLRAHLGQPLRNRDTRPIPKHLARFAVVHCHFTEEQVDYGSGQWRSTLEL
jgi:hypothetical protein